MFHFYPSLQEEHWYKTAIVSFMCLSDFVLRSGDVHYGTFYSSCTLDFVAFSSFV